MEIENIGKIEDSCGNSHQYNNIEDDSEIKDKSDQC